MHYVIGDVHGCYEEMMTLLDKIEQMDANAQIYFVGDFIDRGPDVDKVLAWCMEHITPGGKYQSVRGNHEQMVLDWYRNEWLPWWAIGGFSNPLRRGMPETYYDFSKWMSGMGMLAPEKLQPYMDFFESLPYHITLELESAWGKINTFRIVHAYYEHNDLPEEQQHHSNLWMRMDCGNLESDDILVHGHTPTLNLDYMFWAPKDTAPGMISYRKNDINIDGGCVFAESFPSYPDFLCAVRLEDLLEIYPCAVEERFLHFVGKDADRELQIGRSDRYKERYLTRESRYRLDILRQMGKTV